MGKLIQPRLAHCPAERDKRVTARRQQNRLKKAALPADARERVLALGDRSVGRFSVGIVPEEFNSAPPKRLRRVVLILH